MSFLKTIDEYQVVYPSNTNKFTPTIYLKEAGKYIASLIFLPKSFVLPPDKLSGNPPSDPYFTLYYNIDDFQNCIDLLRNEKPMFLQWGSAPNPMNYISTLQEPVGEGE